MKILTKYVKDNSTEWKQHIRIMENRRKPKQIILTHNSRGKRSFRTPLKRCHKNHARLHGLNLGIMIIPTYLTLVLKYTGVLISP
jgi:hypothetical protein